MFPPLRGPILVVEDDPDMRELLVLLLEDEGCQLRTATNGREGLARMAEHPSPALVILDMNLPLVDGHRLLTTRAANTSLREIPVVILSAGLLTMNARDIAHYGSKLRVAALLPKPLDGNALLQTVRRHALLAPEATGAGAML